MIMDLFIAKAKSINDKFQNLYGTGATNIEHIWRSTAASSPFRRIMLDLHIAGYAQFGDDGDVGYSQPLQAFYRDLAVAGIVAYHEYDEVEGGIQFPWDGDICRYHSHTGKPRNFSCTKKSG